MFTGREYVANFGVYEYRNRAYHPGLGRFMSEDPKLFANKDYNLFRYCANDPLDRTDPMGLTPIQLAPDVQALEEDAADRVFQAASPWQHFLSPPEFAVSTWRDSKTQRARLSQAKRGPLPALHPFKPVSVQPPTKPGKTNEEETHVHWTKRNDDTTLTPFSRGDLHHGNAMGTVQQLLIFGTGDRWRFRPDDTLYTQDRGGIIETSPRGTHTWTIAPRQNTNVSGAPFSDVSLHAPSFGPTGKIAPTANPVSRGNVIVPDTAESDSNLAGVNPLLRAAGL